MLISKLHKNEICWERTDKKIFVSKWHRQLKTTLMEAQSKHLPLLTEKKTLQESYKKACMHEQQR